MGRISSSVLRKILKTWQAVSCVSCETRFCESGCGMDRLNSQGDGFPGRWQIHAFLKPFGVAGGAGMLKTERVSSGGLGESHP